MIEPTIPTAIEASAAQLGRQAGLGDVQTIEPLPGGRNNRVYRVVGSSATGILKQYYQPPGALHDRFATEMAWYRFCEKHAVRWMPRRWAADEGTRSALFEEIHSGSKLSADEVSTGHVAQAIEFFEDVNAFRELAGSAEMPLAAEACFSLADHCRRIEQRFERLTSRPAEDCLSAELQEWLAGDCRQVWDAVTARMHEEFTPVEWNATLSPTERCLSPSDFGFHNALQDAEGRMWFLDFEYSGWDDPAKLVCDFYWQVEVPAPRDTMPLWNAALAPFGPDAPRRVRALFPLIGLKWCTIVLNEFLRDGADRREFAGHAPTIDRRHGQLVRAQRILDDVRSMIR